MKFSSYLKFGIIQWTQYFGFLFLEWKDDVLGSNPHADLITYFFRILWNNQRHEPRMIELEKQVTEKFIVCPQSIMARQLVVYL